MSSQSSASAAAIDALAKRFKEVFKVDGDVLDALVKDFKCGGPTNTNNGTTSEKTIAQWQTFGGYVLANGEKVSVHGDSDKTYEVSKTANGDNIWCTCPAWKYQRKNPLVRTCKHCEAVCGASQEAKRVSDNVAKLMFLNMTQGKNYKI
jgi:hypothetical protein